MTIDYKPKIVGGMASDADYMTANGLHSDLDITFFP